MLAGLIGASLGASLLLTLGALPDELKDGAGDGISVSCADGAETCDVSIRERADWVDEKTARSLGVEPVRWISTVNVPAEKLTAVLTEILTGAGCTVSDGKPPAARSKLVLPSPCEGGK